MARPTLAGSASLHLRLGIFGILFTTLAVIFSPLAAFLLAVVASVVLAKL